LLLEFNANPDTADGGTLQTPLHIAAEAGDVGVVELLLQYRARTNVKEADGDTPLHLASSASFPDIVAMLLDGDADPRKTPKP
jgi:ankyrin repeat protein